MYAVAAELWWSEGALSEGDYWRKILEILAKYSSLLPKVLDTTQESEAKRVFALYWEKRKDLDECCRYFVEDYVFTNGDQPPYDIRACTHPENDPCAGSEGYSGFCCIHCPEEDNCDHKCPPLRKWLEMYSEGETHNLEEIAEECSYSEWDTADCDHPPDCAFLKCTLESKKPCCPEPGICCAQCNLISTCVLVCQQFEGAVPNK